jgi:muramidase (phage lysozyme)
MAEIGSFGPSRREVSPISPGIDPNAFGAGVGQALGQLSQSLGQRALIEQNSAEANTTMSLAYKQRQDKLERAKLEVGYIDLSNQLNRDVLDLYDKAPADGAGFTNTVEKHARDKIDAFKRQVPERLQPEFFPQLETTYQSSINSGFKLQTNAENADFTRSVSKVQTDTVSAILSSVIQNPDDISAIEAEGQKAIDRLLANSPLDAASTREIKDQVSVALKSAKLGRETVEEALGNSYVPGGQIPETVNGVVKSKGPVASGLSREEVGFLNAIAGPESNGEYNRMFSQDGPKYFQSFADHPRSSSVIRTGPNAGKVSSAAGKYQFLSGTWDEAAAALGLTSFSPENQDRAALWLASRDYQKQTGRDLMTVLRSGNIPAIIAAKRMLTGTWEGLGNVSDSAFVSTISAATGNPSNLVNDPEFQIIPFGDRMAIVQDAAAQADKLRSAMATENEARRKTQVDQLQRDLVDGQKGAQDIMAAYRKGTITLEEKDSLDKTNMQYHENEIRSGQFLSGLTDNSKIFDPSNEDDKKNANAFVSSTRAGEQLDKGNTEYVNNLLVPMLAKTGFVPSSLSSLLVAQSSSTDPAKASFALETMAKMRAGNPSAFDKSMDSATTAAVVLYNGAVSSLPKEELLNYIRGQSDPAQRALQDQRHKEVQKLITDDPAKFTPSGLADSMGLSPTIDMAAGAGLFTEFMPVFEYMYAVTNDVDKSMQLAGSVVSARWGDMDIGGVVRTMRYPPNKVYPSFLGSHAYVSDQLESDFGLSLKDNYELSSDARTDFEVNHGQTPTYTVSTIDEYGLPRSLTYGDTAEFDPREDAALANTPVRFHARITDDMIGAQVKREVTESKLHQAQQDMWGKPSDLLHVYKDDRPFAVRQAEQIAKQDAATKQVFDLQHELAFQKIEPDLTYLEKLLDFSGFSKSLAFPLKAAKTKEELVLGLEKLQADPVFQIDSMKDFEKARQAQVIKMQLNTLLEVVK